MKNLFIYFALALTLIIAGSYSAPARRPSPEKPPASPRKFNLRQATAHAHTRLAAREFLFDFLDQETSRLTLAEIPDQGSAPDTYQQFYIRPDRSQFAWSKPAFTWPDARRKRVLVLYDETCRLAICVWPVGAQNYQGGGEACPTERRN